MVDVGVSTRAPLLGEPLPVELMNTVWADRGGVHDALTTDAEVLGWLQAVTPRLPVGLDAVREWINTVQPAALVETAVALRGLRDALRRLAADTTDDPRPAASLVADRATAVATLNRATGASPSWSRLAWDPGHAPIRSGEWAGPGGPHVVSWLAEEGIALIAGGGRIDLRACLAPGCVLYFVAGHGRRTWCSAGCGNRARVARHYRRTRLDAATVGVLSCRATSVHVTTS